MVWQKNSRGWGDDPPPHASANATATVSGAMVDTAVVSVIATCRDVVASSPACPVKPVSNGGAASRSVTASASGLTSRKCPGSRPHQVPTAALSSTTSSIPFNGVLGATIAYPLAIASGNESLATERMLVVGDAD